MDLTYFKEFNFSHTEQIDMYLNDYFPYKIESNDDLSMEQWKIIHDYLKQTYGDPLILEESRLDVFPINKNALWEFWGGCWYFKHKDICSYIKLKFLIL